MSKAGKDNIAIFVRDGKGLINYTRPVEVHDQPFDSRTKELLETICDKVTSIITKK